MFGLRMYKTKTLLFNGFASQNSAITIHDRRIKGKANRKRKMFTSGSTKNQWGSICYFGDKIKLIRSQCEEE